MELREGTVHVWRIDVRRPWEGAASLLSPDEAARAARFRRERDRESFVRTRAALRSLVGSYAGTDPAAVELRYGPKGKPELHGLAFNASHAGDVGLIAIARSGRVGVDVEEMVPADDLPALAGRFFTGAENRALEALAPEDLVAGFYGCWTRKEAFVKALGEGLSFALDRAEVSVPPDPARLLSIDGDAAAAAAWVMADVDAGPGYAGCVAIDAPGADVVVREWAGVSGAAR